MTATQARAEATADQARELLESARDKQWLKPSFGKQLFLGRFRLDLISPWPTADPEKAARAETFLPKLREYLAAHVDGAQIERKALTLAGSANPAIGALLSAHQSIGVPQPLKMYGTPEQKKRFLPRLAAGEVSAFLLTEPDVGSDPARMRTTAT